MTRLGLLLVVGAIGCGRPGAFRPLQVGDPAPDYVARALDGDSVRLKGLQGQAVIVNVWATWCIPCRREMPSLEALSAAYADSGLRVLGVSVDDPGGDDAVRSFLSENGITFTVLRDPSKRIERTFRTMGVPETFLLDRRGKIARRWIGEFDPAAPETRRAIRAVLGAVRP